MKMKLKRVGPRYLVSFIGFFITMSSFVALFLLETKQVIPYWLYFAGFVPSFLFFQMFMHDAIHYAVHPNRRVNEILGWIGSFIVGAPLTILRYTHLAHHQYVGTKKDPDYRYYHLKWYQVWVFLFLGFLYTPYISKLNRRRQIIAVGHILVCLSVWIAFPYLSFKYWVIPGMVSGFFFGFVFIYAAHSEAWEKRKYLFGPLASGHDAHHELPSPSLWNWIIDGKTVAS